MKEIEIWKDIPGYEGVYQVSNLGRVKSIAREVPVAMGRGRNKKGTQTVKEKILKPCIDRGYQRITLSFQQKTLRKNVHQLVAMAFISNPANKPHINHINGVHDDNRVENLEWCTPSENENHSYKVLGKVNPIRKLTIHQVESIKKRAIKGNQWLNGERKSGNILSLSKEFGVCIKTIHNVINGKCYA